MDRFFEKLQISWQNACMIYEAYEGIACDRLKLPLLWTGHIIFSIIRLTSVIFHTLATECNCFVNSFLGLLERNFEFFCLNKETESGAKI